MGVPVCRGSQLSTISFFVFTVQAFRKSMQERH